MAEQIVADQTQKPPLDEQTLQRLLEAAFVLQEHSNGSHDQQLQNDRLKEHEFIAHARPGKLNPGEDFSSSDDGSLPVTQIDETQRQIQTHHFEFEKAVALITESIVKITNASGAAVAISNGKKVQYRAALGPSALPLGSEVAVDEAICSACLRTGHVINCADVNSEFLVDVEECRRRGIQSLVAVPVYREGSVVGALEIYFSETQAFTSQDVHTCQLMAGVVTEVVGRDSELTPQKSLTIERTTVLEAAKTSKPGGTSVRVPEEIRQASYCRKCGHELIGEEQFCGKCGSPRGGVSKPSSLQSKVATLWQRQQAAKAASSSGISVHGEDSATLDVRNSKAGSKLPAPHDPEEIGTTGSDPQKEIVPTDAVPFSVSADSDRDTHPLVSDSKELQPPPYEVQMPQEKTALTKSQEDIIWNSAAKAREALEALAASRTHSPVRRFWNSRRGDVYLAVAVILVVVVIRWGVWSNDSVGATAGGSPSSIPGATHRRKPAPDADLSIFEKLLVSLGLAEAPDRPEYKGNPDTQVWVDLRSALYYCPGSDLYGKTEKGKLTSQRSAQLDQFEPASRKACD